MCWSPTTRVCSTTSWRRTSRWFSTRPTWTTTRGPGVLRPSEHVARPRRAHRGGPRRGARHVGCLLVTRRPRPTGTVDVRAHGSGGRQLNPQGRGRHLPGPPRRRGHPRRARLSGEDTRAPVCRRALQERDHQLAPRSAQPHRLLEVRRLDLLQLQQRRGAPWLRTPGAPRCAPLPPGRSDDSVLQGQARPTRPRGPGVLCSRRRQEASARRLQDRMGTVFR